VSAQDELGLVVQRRGRRRHGELGRVVWPRNLLTATVMSATSEWVSPPTRPELIESLVSGVGSCNFEALLLQQSEMLQTATIHQTSESSRITYITKSVAGNMIVLQTSLF